MSKPFYQQLVDERERIGINQADCVALFSGLAIGTLRNWETGRNMPPEWAQPLILERLRREKPRKEGTFVKRGRPRAAED